MASFDLFSDDLVQEKALISRSVKVILVVTSQFMLKSNKKIDCRV
jgi:hypothetical protein